MKSLDRKLIASIDEEGLIRAHGRLENARILPKDMKNPVVLPSCVANDPPLMPSSLQTRTLRLQESGARSKTKVLDHRAQEDGQGCCKQLCPLPETVQKTPRSVDGPSAKFTSGSWIPPLSNTAMDIFGPLEV